MVRTPAANYSSPGYNYATADGDAFDRTDVSSLGQAVDQHDHSTGKGLTVNVGSIPPGSLDGSKLIDGTVTSAKIQDGTIATADLANAAVTNAKLGTDTARLNLLTNGGFEIWQRGVGPFTANGAYSADRWLNNLDGTDTLSVSRDGSNIDLSGWAAAACTYVKGTGVNTLLFQALQPSTEHVQLRGRVVTVSIRVRTSTANAVRAWMNTGTATLGTAHSGGGAYETLTVSTTVPTAATVLNVGVNFMASCTAYLDNAMLVVGSVPADYAPLHPADEWARCLRYYEILGEAPNEFIVVGYGGAGLNDYRFYGLKARKAVAPTATKTGTWTITNCSQPVVSSGVTGVTVSTTVTALGAFNYNNNTAGATITIEANP